MKAKRFSIGLLLLIVLAILIVGCTSTAPLPPTLSSTPALPTIRPTTPTPVYISPIPTQSPALMPSTLPPAPGEPAVARAVADLAARLDVDPDAVTVVRISADDFPAQNLGCPSPGGKGPEPVQPAFVTGQEIVLRVGEQQYVYRAHGGSVVFCWEVP
ncbi:MAG TPA: hypothetical protein ENI37_05325 [Chloroflexi bacterium]|nr:hypothetical protein [Chloroflexota bacterium]